MSTARRAFGIALALLGSLALLGAVACAPADPAKRVAWIQQLGAPLPLHLGFRDESNRPVSLGSYFRRTPVVLVPTYFSCPELCPLVLQGVQESLQGTELTAGRDYQVLAVSFDPRDTPRQATEKRSAVLTVTRIRQAAHFLTAADGSGAALARALGLRFTPDAEHGQFAHPAGIVIVNSRGVIGRYIFGVRYPPEQLRTALIEVGRGHVAAFTDQLWMLCYHFDPTLGRHSLAIIAVLRTAAILAVLLGALAVWRLSSSGSGTHPAPADHGGGPR